MYGIWYSTKPAICGMLTSMSENCMRKTRSAGFDEILQDNCPGINTTGRDETYQIPSDADAFLPDPSFLKRCHSRATPRQSFAPYPVISMYGMIRR